MYDELGGAKLLPSFVEAGSVDGKKFALPYYFGSRYVFARTDVWKEAGVAKPTTLEEFNTAVKTIAQKNPRGIKNFSGFFIGGQDWRNGISWVFANGGDLAKKENGQWVSTLSDPNTLKGLGPAPGDLHRRRARPRPTPRTRRRGSTSTTATSSSTPTASRAARPRSRRRRSWPRAGRTGRSATLEKKDGKDVRTWDPKKFETFVLPGTDGKPAPVFAGGSNIAISAKSKNPALAKELMKIVFSPEYQQKLGGAGLGPANSDYVSSLGDDEFAKALMESASNSKLTPAAPGWAAVESSMVMEEFFGKIRGASDLAALGEGVRRQDHPDAQPQVSTTPAAGSISRTGRRGHHPSARMTP